MTNPTAREVIWISNCHQVRDAGVDGGTDSIDRLTDASIAALTAAGYKIVPTDETAIAETSWTARLKLARAEGYAAGYEVVQRDMMDKVLRMCFDKNLTVFADYIRALPINPPPAEAGKEKNDAS